MEKTQNTGLEYLPYKFTAKELDEETGLYYYGARYLDPKYSMWISTDPALGEYIPKAPIDEEAKKYNQNLPGMGGVFNHINGDLYAYAGNNPVRYIDPDGNENFSALFWNFLSSYASGSDKITTLYVSASNGNESSRIKLNNLSMRMTEIMKNVATDSAIKGMEFIADNGSSLALVAYSSGHVEIGTVIDGLTVACDVTLAFSDADKTGDYKKFARKLTTEIIATAVSHGVAMKTARKYMQAFNKIPDSLSKKAVDSLSNIIGEFYGIATEKITEELYETIQK